MEEAQKQEEVVGVAFGGDGASREKDKEGGGGGG